MEFLLKNDQQFNQEKHTDDLHVCPHFGCKLQFFHVYPFLNTPLLQAKVVLIHIPLKEINQCRSIVSVSSLTVIIATTKTNIIANHSPTLLFYHL